MANENGLRRVGFGSESDDSCNGVGEFGQRNRHRQFFVIGDVEPIAGDKDCIARR